MISNQILQSLTVVFEVHVVKYGCSCARRWTKKEDVELDTLFEWIEWIESIGNVLKLRIR